jgi:hypothetical protein
VHSIRYKAAAVLAAISLAGTARAAEMTAAEIKALLSGNTIYVETTGAAGTGLAGHNVLYFASGGSILFKNPKGMWHGTWAFKGDTVCFDWKEAPNTPCRKYDKQGEAISVINVATGEVVAKVVKTAPGNPKKLAP